MGTVFGSAAAASGGSNLSFRNITNSILVFQDGSGNSYTVGVNQVVTIASSIASSSTQIADLLLGGQLQELTVFGATPATPIVPSSSSTPTSAAVTFSAATESSIVGNFDGVGIDTVTGYLILADGNRPIYPNSQVRSQPAAGATSAVTISANMQRLGSDGSVGFAIYTDAAATDHFFNNGYEVMFESTGLCEIYQYTNGRLNDITDRTTQVPYPFDLNSHSFDVVITQTTSNALKLFAYVDGNVYAQAVLTNAFVVNGRIGFSTANGCSEVLIVPGSFSFSLGTNVQQSASEIVQQVISDVDGQTNLNIPATVTGTLPIGANSPSVIAGAITGTSANLVPDSGLKFDNALWDDSDAGSMTIAIGVGASGGKGIVFSNPTDSAANAGTYQYSSSAIAVTPGTQFTMSGNILATAAIPGGTGLPAWELWSYTGSGPDTFIDSAVQPLGQPLTPLLTTRRVQETTVIPAGVTQVCYVASLNNVAVEAGGTIVFSEPDLQTGPYATAYVANLLGDQSSTLPLATSPTEVQSVIVEGDVAGSGALLLSQAAPGSFVPYTVMPYQLTNVVSASGSGGSYLASQTVNNAAVQPGSITQNSTSQVIYTNNNIANTYDNLTGNYYWYLAGTGAVAGSGAAIPDGSNLIYQVGIADASASPAPFADGMAIAGNSTITVVWNHPAFIGTSLGSTSVLFVGQPSSVVASVLATATLSSSSTPSITSSVSTQTIATPSNGTLTNSGTPTIVTNTVTRTIAVAASAAYSDASTASISSSNNTSTLPTPFTGTVPPVYQTPQITSNTTYATSPSQHSAITSDTSTPTITSAVVAIPTATAEGATDTYSETVGITVVGTPFSGNFAKLGTAAAYAGTASIGSNVTTEYTAPTLTTATALSINSHPSITTTGNTTYAVNQHDSGYLNGGAVSTCYISGSVSYPVTVGSNTGFYSTLGNQGSSHTSSGTCAGLTTYTWTAIGNASLQEYGIPTASNAYCDGSNPVACTYTLPASFSASTGKTGAISVINGGRQSCLPENTLTTTVLPLTWYCYLYAPNGAYIQGWSGLSGSSSIASYAGGGQTGTYTFYFLPQWQTDPGGSTTGNAAGQVLSYAQPQWPVASGSYAGNNGAAEVLFRLPAAALAPTSPSTQISFNCPGSYGGGLSDPADGYGASGIGIYFADPTNSYEYVGWNNIGAGNYTYYNASAPAGQAYVFYLAEMVTVNGNGTSSYNPNVAGDVSWYQNDATMIYSSASSNGGSQSTTTSTYTVSPSSSTQISVAISGLSCGSDANGASALNLILTDAAGATVSNANYTANGTYVLTNTAGVWPAGAYTLQATGVIKTVNSGITTSSNYSVAGSVALSTYESTPFSVTNYVAANGTIKTYSTGSATVAPTSAGTEVSLAVSSVTCPTNAAGTSYYQVTLVDPTGNPLTFSNGSASASSFTAAAAATYTYQASGAVAGIYVWSITSVVVPTNTATGTYAVSLTGQAGWYEFSSGTNYVSTGATTDGTGGGDLYYYTTSATLAPTSPSLQIALTLSSLVLPSDATGSSSIKGILIGPGALQVGSTYTASSGSPSTVTWTYSNPSAVAGTYYWQLWSVSTPTNTGTTSSSYTCTANIANAWWEDRNVNQTTYTANRGASATFVTGAATLAPTTSALELQFNVTAITCGTNSFGTSSYNVTLLNSSGTQVQNWPSVATSQTLTYFNASAAAGQYTWAVYAYTTNTNTGTSSYSDSFSGTHTWYENLTTPTTTYTNVPAGATTFNTDVTTLAPTTTATKLTFQINTLVAPSDAYGTSNWKVVLIDPGSNIVQTWTNLTTAQTLQYFNTSAVGGSYTWNIQAQCAYNGTGDSTYSCEIAGTLGWYQNVTSTTTNYNVTPGVPNQMVTTSSTYAPTSSAQQISFTFSSLSLPSDSHGSTEYLFTLQDPTGAVVQSWAVTSTSTLSYWNASATAGVYTLSYNASISLSGSPAVDSFSTSFAGALGWFTPTPQTITSFVSDPAPQISTGQTGTTALAPTSSGTALQLQITSLTLPSDSAGATQYVVTLKDPSGVVQHMQTVTVVGTITYFNSAALAGQWTWAVNATCTNTSTATASYTTHLQATLVWYTSVTGQVTTYTNHDGATSTYSTAANTVAPTSSSTELTLDLTSVAVASKSYGSCELAVMLTDPNGAVINAMTTTGIVGPITLTYSDAAAISGIYTWTVWGQAINNSTGSGSFSTSWAGSYVWYQPALGSAGVFILAADGVSQRQTVSDSDIQFLSITPSQATFNVSNNASSTLAFSLGIISKGF